MANNAKVMYAIKSFLERMKANDADIPEELAEDALEMVEGVKDALSEEEIKAEDEEVIEEEVETKDEDEEEKVDIDKKVEDAVSNVLRKYGLIKDGTMEALDELEKKLGEEESKDADGEEEATEDPEKINDDAIRLLRKVKPAIASVKDARTRKILSDNFAKAINMNRSTADYGRIFEITRNAAADAINNVKTSDADYDFGMDIARRYNPHYKEEN